MKSNTEAIEYLQDVHRRFVMLKDIFNSFQVQILRITERIYPVDGILVVNTSDTFSSVSFAGRDYEIEFGYTSTEEGIKGTVTCFRKTGENERIKISCLIFNDAAVVDIEPPEGDDPIVLNEDICSALVVLNWLCQDSDS